MRDGAHKQTDWAGDVKTAKELCYPNSVILALKVEADPIERQRILTNARHEIYPNVSEIGRVKKHEVIDILERWTDKSTEVQNEYIENFKRDLHKIIRFVMRQ